MSTDPRTRLRAAALTALIMAALIGGLFVLVLWPRAVFYGVSTAFFVGFGVVLYRNLRDGRGFDD
jgi:hypothetical protein